MILDYLWNVGEKEESDRNSSSSCLIRNFILPLSLLVTFSMYLYSFLVFMPLFVTEVYSRFSFGVC